MCQNLCSQWKYYLKQRKQILFSKTDLLVDIKKKKKKPI